MDRKFSVDPASRAADGNITSDDVLGSGHAWRPARRHLSRSFDAVRRTRKPASTDQAMKASTSDEVNHGDDDGDAVKSERMTFGEPMSRLRWAMPETRPARGAGLRHGTRSDGGNQASGAPSVLREEVKRHPVVAPTLVRRRRTIVEHMSVVSAATSAVVLRSRYQKREVALGLEGVGKPVPLSYFIAELNTGRRQPAHT